MEVTTSLSAKETSTNSVTETSKTVNQLSLEDLAIVPPSDKVDVVKSDLSQNSGTEAIPTGFPISPKNIYEAVLPLILDRLDQPLDAKSLAERLEVRQGQMQDWLNKAVAEGKVIKTKKPVAYVVNRQATQLSLLCSSEMLP
ncbi:hypothetical protein ACE1CI_00255 [Aerosakkonemataceae cyanobacterium BLCC-F50]|uniref:Uncharacterized protein n=1 Tax=Floridaenema flaviceps BLCC-F50 TaxID=3153642 RepID=A0ABV4XI27_9CYAN